MKKKVLVVTINDNNNYGNRLQNYALCETIKSLGYSVSSLSIKSVMHENIIYTLLRYFKSIINGFRKKKNAKRLNNFKCFNDCYINFTTRKVHFYNNLKKFENNFDFFVVGSDQVWNQSMTHNFNIYFLEGIDDNKKISYAASFGLSDYNRKYIYRYQKDLNSFKSISVREYVGKEIVSEITNRNDVEVSIDPTMLISSEQWDKISKKPEMLENGKFILIYFLGSLNEKIKEQIEKVAKENNCYIINVLDKDSPYYSCGPAEFLYLEKHAFLICTDSFHSCVFSLLFDRPFIVFDRESASKRNMNSRIDSLIKTFNLKNRRYNGKKITDSNLLHDYSEAYQILDNERKRSIEFLSKSFDESRR